MPLGDDDLDGHSLRRRDDDSTFVRIAIRRPTADASPPLPYPAPRGGATHCTTATPTLMPST